MPEKLLFAEPLRIVLPNDAGVKAVPVHMSVPVHNQAKAAGGDGSTRYDIDVPIQIHGFDPDFFFGMTFSPEGFADMKDKYFLLNGRGYPDTIGIPPGVTVDGNVLPASWTGGVSGAGNPDPNTFAISTQGSDTRPSQPLPSLITLSLHAVRRGRVALVSVLSGQRAALRIADLDVQEYQTLSMYKLFPAWSRSNFALKPILSTGMPMEERRTPSL